MEDSDRAYKYYQLALGCSIAFYLNFSGTKQERDTIISSIIVKDSKETITLRHVL